MGNWLGRDEAGAGFVLGLCNLLLISGLLNGLDYGFERMTGRSLLLKPETIPLVTLAIMTIMFRWLIATRKTIASAKGFFLALFIAAICYLINRKLHLITTI